MVVDDGMTSRRRALGPLTGFPQRIYSVAFACWPSPPGVSRLRMQPFGMVARGETNAPSCQCRRVAVFSLPTVRHVLWEWCVVRHAFWPISSVFVATPVGTFR